MAWSVLLSVKPHCPIFRSQNNDTCTLQKGRENSTEAKMSMHNKSFIKLRARYKISNYIYMAWTESLFLHDVQQEQQLKQQQSIRILYPLF
jgi:hypothetical protein